MTKEEQESLELRPRTSHYEEILLYGIPRLLNSNTTINRMFVAKVAISGYPISILSFKATSHGLSHPWHGWLHLTNDARIIVQKLTSITVTLSHDGIGFKLFLLRLTALFREKQRRNMKNVIWREKHYVDKKLKHAIQLSFTRSDKTEAWGMKSRLRVIFSSQNAESIILNGNDLQIINDVIPVSGYSCPELSETEDEELIEDCNSLVQIKR
jgi:hypothetical protein